MERSNNVRRGPASAGWRRGLVVGALLMASGCATPVEVTRVNTQAMYEALTASVLSTGSPSQHSGHLLIRLGLSARFDVEPEAARRTTRPGRRFVKTLAAGSIAPGVSVGNPATILEVPRVLYMR